MAGASPSELRAMLPELIKEIQAANSIVLASHVNPDGDSIGSLLAMSFVLDQLNKPHTVLTHHQPPRNLKFLPQVERLTQIEEDLSPDLAIVLDLENLDRVGASLLGTIEKAKRLVVIDHHIPHERPGDLRIISTKSPATASILADLIQDSEIQITQEIATCLLTGIITDTGSFRFPNTTSHAMHCAAGLLEAGASLAQIIEEVYMRASLPSIRLKGEALSRLKLSLDNRIAWTCLPYEVFQEHQASDEDTEGLVNELLAIETVEIAAILREHSPGIIRGSLRSRGERNVAILAREFGGGGHKNAAGVSFRGSIDKAESQLVEEMKKCLALP